MVVVVLPFVCFSTNKDNKEKQKDKTSNCCSNCEVATPEIIEIPSIDATDEVISKEQNEKGLEEKIENEPEKKATPIVKEEKDPDPTPQEIYVEEIPKNSCFNEKNSTSTESFSKEGEESSDSKQDQIPPDEESLHPNYSIGSKEYVYVPGFGCVKDHGGIAVGRKVGKKGDKLTGHLVGSMD